jgi:hypothetical protein
MRPWPLPLYILRHTATLLPTLLILRLLILAMSVLPADTQLLFTLLVHTIALTSTALIKPTITSDLTAPVTHTSSIQTVAMDQMTIGASKLLTI